MTQHGLEHALVVGEVLPHRPRHDEAALVAAAEMVDDAGDHIGRDPDVVDGQVTIPADAEVTTDVGGTDAHGEHVVTVRAQERREGGQLVVAGLAVHDRGTPRRAENITGYRVVPFTAIVLVRLAEASDLD